MNEKSNEIRSVVVERQVSHPPEKVWRALTQSTLMEEWLMKNDFLPVVDHRFTLRASWGVVECRVLAIDPNRTLSYTWQSTGLESTVTWVLTPTENGTHVRMEQSGFGPDNDKAFDGATLGWQKFINGLERVLTGLQ